MSASNADRQRAVRIRRRIAAGTATDDDRAWLDAYSAERGTSARSAPNPRPPRPPPVAHAPAPAPAHAPAPAPVATPEIPPAVESTPARPASPTPAPAMVPFNFAPFSGSGAASSPGVPPIPPGSTPTGNLCQIPNCPCKNAGAAGGQYCLNLQKKIFPPMNEDAALGWASLILNGLSFAAKFVREDKRRIKPTDQEIAKFARAIRMVQMRRANWAGAWDDLMALGWAFGSFGMRCLSEPSQTKKALPTPQIGAPNPKAMEDQPKPVEMPGGMSV